MSFSGKRFRRTGGSNLDDFFTGSGGMSQEGKQLMMSTAPIWCYTLLDEQTLVLQLEAEDFSSRKTFKLGVEHELTRQDGGKIRMTFTLEGDNVLKQRVRKSDGKIAYFKREFYDRTATMTITLEGSDNRKAHVFYEVVD